MPLARLLIGTACILASITVRAAVAVRPPLAAATTAAQSSVHTTDARGRLACAMNAMGGRTLLEGLHSLRLDVRRVSYRIDDSERAEGPYWLNIGVGTEWVDEDHRRSSTKLDDASAQWPLDVAEFNGGGVDTRGAMWTGKRTWFAAASRMVDDVALRPERLLLTAAAASDLHSLPDEILHGQTQHVLAFTRKGHPVRLYVDAVLQLPSRLEITGARKGSRSSVMLGDIVWRMDYLFYKRKPDGLVYPHQLNLSRNGKPYVTTVVTALVENAPPPPDGYAPPTDADPVRPFPRVPYGSEPIDPGHMQSLGRHVWLIEGSWNVLVVHQPDGLVVVEAPESGAYSAHVLDLLDQRFPGVPVKAVVSTTDSTWHIAGIRTYVARGIPVYVLDANEARLAQAINASRSLEPDELDRHPMAPQLRTVSAKTTIGTGPAQIDIYPIRGHGDERMMMVYLPGEHLLYGSSNDVNMQQKPKPRATFNAFELERRVDELHLPVREYVAIHTPKMPWSEFRDIVLTQPPISSG